MFLETWMLKSVELVTRLADVRLEYIPQTYSVRVHRTDGSLKLLLGQSGRLPAIEKVIRTG
jgi:hypothetical protein